MMVCVAQFWINVGQGPVLIAAGDLLAPDHPAVLASPERFEDASTARYQVAPR
jgi:hypothetical protein